jgi:hypothetical protein
MLWGRKEITCAIWLVLLTLGFVASSVTDRCGYAPSLRFAQRQNPRAISHMLFLYDPFGAFPLSEFPSSERVLKIFQSL